MCLFLGKQWSYARWNPLFTAGPINACFQPENAYINSSLTLIEAC